MPTTPDRQQAVGAYHRNTWGSHLSETYAFAILIISCSMFFRCVLIGPKEFY